jgi:exopolysaccharide biosynthesis polyprenyl glycosylphosphotransferase
VLIIGDIVTFVASLIFGLAIRYGTMPDQELLGSHIPSFAILWAIFILVHFSAGLYNKQSLLMQKGLVSLLAKTQLFNIVIGVFFFYFAPIGITPKTNLFIYFVASIALLFLWRIVMAPVFSVTRKQNAILVGDGFDVQELQREVNNHFRYGLNFGEHVAPRSSVDETVSAITAAVKNSGATVIVADLHNPTIEKAMPFLYSLIFSGIQVIDAGRLYEEIFDRIPLSLVGDRWLVEHSATALGTRRVYDTLKRAMDIVIAGIAGIISLIVYPFIYIAIKLDDKGPIFVFQERVGKSGKLISIAKFRSMTSDDSGVYKGNGKENDGKSTLRVTRVGKVIRLTRIDELPQLWSVLKGDQSLIGPRPELPALTSIYEKEIPYYNARHLIKPGLSGWAQIYHRAHPHHAVAVEDTRDKLSYDLYYVKNRSIALDVRIALQTAKALLSRQGV